MKPDDSLDRQRAAILAALRKAGQLALWRHKCLGQPIFARKDGKLMWIPASDIEVEPPS